MPGRVFNLFCFSYWHSYPVFLEMRKSMNAEKLDQALKNSAQKHLNG